MGRQGQLQLAIANSVAAVKITVPSGSGGAYFRDGTNPYIIGRLLEVVVGKGQPVMDYARAPACRERRSSRNGSAVEQLQYAQRLSYHGICTTRADGPTRRGKWLLYYSCVTTSQTISFPVVAVCRSTCQASRVQRLAMNQSLLLMHLRRLSRHTR